MGKIIKKGRDQSDKDFSGLDFADEEFNRIDFHESVFNGTHFRNVKFINCNLPNTEFTEAKFSNCIFIKCNLNNSDFVLTKLHKVGFSECTFSHVEWRDTGFNEVEYSGCLFNNSTISLCMFTNIKFDKESSESFAGTSKRFNVFSNASFYLSETKLEFLKINYGLRLEDNKTEFQIDVSLRNDPYLVLSALRYSNKLSSKQFIELILKATTKLKSKNEKNRIQKMKYISLISRFTIEQRDVSVFGQQLLVNSLNEISKQIPDNSIFIELLSLIMFIKTNIYKTTFLPSEGPEELREYISTKTKMEMHLYNSYSKKQIQEYFNIMENFINIPKRSFKIIRFENGSSIVEATCAVAIHIGVVLAFISFSLSKVSKSVEHLVNIKKNTKSLFSKSSPTNKDNRVKGTELLPHSIMANEGNKYYVQVNNIVTQFGKDAIKIEGTGSVKIIVDNSTSSSDRN